MTSPLISLLSAPEVGRLLAQRIKSLRLQRRWTRDTLAQRAGVTSASLKRFETTGKCSLELLLKAAQTLGRIDEFAQLLLPPPAQSMDELEHRAETKIPRRGRI